MKNTAIVALAFLIFAAPSFAQEKSWEEKEREIRCFMLNKWVGELDEMAKDGSSLGNVYSSIFKFNVIERTGDVKVSKDDRDRVDKIEKIYENLKEGKIETDGPKASSAAIKKATSDLFYAMHNINKRMVLDADRNHPYCNLLKTPTTTAAPSKTIPTTPRKAQPRAASGALQ